MKRAWLPALLLTSLAQAVAAQERFTRTTVRIQSDSGPVVLRVELAITPEQQASGLQLRDRLDSDAGMLFMLGEPVAARTPAITMFLTRIPLDVAFLDRAGRIVDIVTTEPCTLDSRLACRRYESAAQFWGVLEVNAGFFARHSIRVGHVVQRVPPDQTCYLWSVFDRTAHNGEFILSQDTIGSADSKRAYLRATSTAEPGWLRGTWREHTPDSIRVVVRGRWAGYVFTLQRRTEPLTGMLDYSSDVILVDSNGVPRPRPPMRVQARSQACPFDTPFEQPF